MRRVRTAVLVMAALMLHACATPRETPSGPSPSPEPEPSAPERPEPSRPAAPAPAPAPSPSPRPAPSAAVFDVLGLAALPGWSEADHAEGLAAFQTGCERSAEPAMKTACARARALGKADAETARAFFEENFRVEPLSGEGVLTAYFAPQYEARPNPEGEFVMPVRPAPADLRPGRPYATRAEIEDRPPNDALAWMRAEDLFFLQIQGSGVLVFPDGSRRKAVFAAHNDRPFSGIANPMRDRGLLAGDNTSGEAIRTWLAENRGPRANEIMRINPRYVFFRLTEDDGLDPAGAAGVPLPAGHAIAVDPSHHRYGDLYWIDASAPILAGAFPKYQRLVMALDTGGAIRGPIRADLYLGRGDAAGREAGRVRHDLRMYRLVPRE